MKIITSVTVFNDAIGTRMSATYSEIDEATGRVISDNNRFDRVITDKDAKGAANSLIDYATESLPEYGGRTMPTNGMTIDSLNTVSSLTAQDKVPVWDNESSGEPTRKITAQNLTNSVKTLGSLVNTTEMNDAIAQSTAIKVKTFSVNTGGASTVSFTMDNKNQIPIHVSCDTNDIFSLSSRNGSTWTFAFARLTLVTSLNNAYIYEGKFNTSLNIKVFYI